MEKGTFETLGFDASKLDPLLETAPDPTGVDFCLQTCHNCGSDGVVI